MKILLPLLSIFCCLPALGSDCRFPGSKIVLAKSSSGHTAEWTIVNQAFLHKPVSKLSPSPAYRRYVSWVKTHTSLSAIGIMKRAREIYRKAAAFLDESDGGRSDFLDAVYDMDLIIKEKAGTIRPMSCLEAVPFQEFLAVVDLTRSGAEFMAYVLEKEGALKVLGDFYRPRSAAAGMGVEASPALVARLSVLRRSGWRLMANYHNHPFNFGRQEDFGGNIAPSAPDLELYRALGPHQSLISNGIETLSVRRKELPLFRSRSLGFHHHL